jgi:hypothetical protein
MVNLLKFEQFKINGPLREGELVYCITLMKLGIAKKTYSPESYHIKIPQRYNQINIKLSYSIHISDLRRVIFK